MVLLRPNISTSQFAELAKTQKGAVNHLVCEYSKPTPSVLGGGKFSLSGYRIWLKSPGAGETFPCSSQAQTFPRGCTSDTEMSCAAAYMMTLLVAFLFFKWINNRPSVFKHLSPFLSFDDHFSLFFHAAIMSLNSFVNDSYYLEGHTV